MNAKIEKRGKREVKITPLQCCVYICVHAKAKVMQPCQQTNRSHLCTTQVSFLEGVFDGISYPPTSDKKKKHCQDFDMGLLYICGLLV